MKKLFSEIPYLQGGRITLKEIRQRDAAALKEMTGEAYVISHLYDECFKESIILGISREYRYRSACMMTGFMSQI